MVRGDSPTGRAEALPPADVARPRPRPARGSRTPPRARRPCLTVRRIGACVWASPAVSSPATGGGRPDLGEGLPAAEQTGLSFLAPAQPSAVRQRRPTAGRGGAGAVPPNAGNSSNRTAESGRTGRLTDERRSRARRAPHSGATAPAIGRPRRHPRCHGPTAKPVRRANGRLTTDHGRRPIELISRSAAHPSAPSPGEPAPDSGRSQRRSGALQDVLRVGDTSPRQRRSGGPTPGRRPGAGPAVPPQAVPARAGMVASETSRASLTRGGRQK